MTPAKPKPSFDPMERVEFAIELIERAAQRKREVHADASSSDRQRQVANQNYEVMEKEFAWQWRNVKLLLERIPK